MSLPKSIWNLFEKRLFPAASCSKTGLFNPYNSVHPDLDCNNADKIRENLKRYVDCVVRSPKSLLVGEAPGWRGIGRVAERALQTHRPGYVRHPSCGGAPEFRVAIEALKRNHRA